MKKFRVASFFSGCGGLDLGFSRAGFQIVWANEYDKTIWDTYVQNHPETNLDKRSIRDVLSNEVPDVDGIIGGPPCQSWSLAGAMRGAEDQRGQLFFEYVRIIKDKQPLFFLAENVAGLVSRTHIDAFENIVEKFKEIGYVLSYKLLDAKDYGVPQDRKRIIIVGYADRVGKKFAFPERTHASKVTIESDILSQHLKPYGTLKNAIERFPPPVPAKSKNKTNGELKNPNHEYMTGSFSTIYMSRNRRRNWDQPSFTIQAGGRHAPMHPGSPPMEKVEEDKFVFTEAAKKYRRMSIRECACVQTFPDEFVFKYNALVDGYKMVGNAVPVELARVLATKIMADLKSCLSAPRKNNKMLVAV